MGREAVVKVDDWVIEVKPGQQPQELEEWRVSYAGNLVCSGWGLDRLVELGAALAAAMHVYGRSSLPVVERV